MKKFVQFLFVVITAMLMSSCTKQEVNRGLYIIPIVFASLAVYKFYNTWKGYNEGTTKQQLPSGTVYTKKKTIPVAELIYGIAFTIASVGTSIGVYSENRNYNPKKDRPYPEKPAPDGKESAEELGRLADSVYKIKK